MGSALIIADVQTGVIESFPWSATVLPPLATLLPVLRTRGLPVIFVRVALRRNGAEVPARNPLASWMFAQGDLFLESSGTAQVHADICPLVDETVIVKRRVSAFNGTDLESVLRSRDVDSIALAGVATSGAVLATLIDAVDRDFAATVLSDCCADDDPEVHDFMLKKILPGRGARVLSSQEWLSEPVHA